MKDKNAAGILALFFGGLGIHRFYLGQVGLGILYLILLPFLGVSFLLGLIDAIALFSMDQQTFDTKYNRDRSQWQERPDFNRQDYRYRERVESRETRREERREYRENRAASRSKTTPAAPARPTNDLLKNSGIQKYKDYDYDGAIEDFEKALEINPNDVAVHFNLACAYSLTEDADRSFFHLDRAVALGFNDTKRIKEHDALAFLRVQDRFDAFEANGFRLAPKFEAAAAPPPEAETTSTIALPGGDLLDQLKRLGELREKGLLSEEEFATQKKKLLG